MASFVMVGLFLAVVVAVAGQNMSSAKVYTVGDALGWTILNSPNYTAWASNKTFRVGDTLVFKYNKQFHNVLEVSKADYRACKNDSALSTYLTGDDSIPIKTPGHHYFICGVPGHCQLNQKVDILAAGGGSSRATAPASSAAPSMAPAVAPVASPTSSTSNTSAPAPNSSARLSATLSLIGKAAVMASAIALLGFNF